MRDRSRGGSLVGGAGRGSELVGIREQGRAVGLRVGVGRRVERRADEVCHGLALRGRGRPARGPGTRAAAVWCGRASSTSAMRGSASLTRPTARRLEASWSWARWRCGSLSPRQGPPRRARSPRAPHRRRRGRRRAVQQPGVAGAARGELTGRGDPGLVGLELPQRGDLGLELVLASGRDHLAADRLRVVGRAALGPDPRVDLGALRVAHQGHDVTVVRVLDERDERGQLAVVAGDVVGAAWASPTRKRSSSSSGSRPRR